MPDKVVPVPEEEHSKLKRASDNRDIPMKYIVRDFIRRMDVEGWSESENSPKNV